MKPCSNPPLAPHPRPHLTVEPLRPQDWHSQSQQAGSRGSSEGSQVKTTGAAQALGPQLFLGRATSRQGRGHSSVITSRAGKVLEESLPRPDLHSHQETPQHSCTSYQGFVANHTDIFHGHGL